MKTRIDESEKLKWLIVEAHEKKEEPVLLYLHGAGQASVYLNELPHVLDHHSPPFQAMMSKLTGVRVIAPQAPYNLNAKDAKEAKEAKDWQWTPHLDEIEKYLKEAFPNAQKFATGFSRGGWGVLQLRAKAPGLFVRWAVVDPQRGNDALLKGIELASGWLAYGAEYPSIQEYSGKLKEKLSKENVRSTPYMHGELAMKAFSGSNLSDEEGAGNLYQFLGFQYGPAS
jgi:predicted peptidase